MSLFDHLLIAFLFLIYPVASRHNFVVIVRRIAAGEALPRIRLYWQTMATEWLLLSILFGVWIYTGRAFESLGFVSPSGAGFWLSCVFVIAAALLLLWYGKRMGGLTQHEREAQRQTFGDLGHFLPQSDDELSTFYQVSVTAGIVEEIVYRGFVIWYLQDYISVWPAVAVSSIAFGLAHSYQGPAGIVRTGLVGGVLGALFVISGSIWVPIAAHILLDAIQGRQIREIYRDVPGQ